MDYLRERFAAIEDGRHQGYVVHKLADILIIIMLSVLCGLDELADIMVFAEKKQEFLKDIYGIEQIPSKATMSRILNMIDGGEVAKVIIGIMKERAGITGGVMAVDGKAIRSTSKKGKPHSALQILTAYMTESGIVLGQEAVHGKTNEIPVFQEMLSWLDVSGKTVTADAMHCQKETCERITVKGGDYVFGLKGNQKNLHDDVALFINDQINAPEIEKFTTAEKNGGRFEKRVCMKVCGIDWLERGKEWAGLKTVFAVNRITETPSGTAEEMSYYISSLDASAERLLQISREHWKIESMHWMLDVVFSEDECMLLSENGHKTLNIFRKLALLIHKQYMAKQPKKRSVKSNILACLIDDSLLSEVLNNL